MVDFHLGIVGAGVMGRGLAQAAASHGIPVVLLDKSEAILADSKASMLNDMRFHQMLDSSSKRYDAEQLMPLIHYTVDMADLSVVNFVVENVTEDWSIKQAVYRALDKVCLPECVFAANTSAMSITKIAGATARPSQVVGIHFMNPVPLKKTVELIEAALTSQATMDLARSFLKAIHKSYVLVKDWPGFISNRVLMLMINEAIFLLQEGVSNAPDVDRLFKSCFEHKMGPLETADMIGLDTILQSIQVLYDSYQDAKYRPAFLLKKMVTAGLLGRKSGQGFYEY